MMRGITGSARGRRLQTLEGEEITRPTTEAVKEAMFSMLQFELEGRKVLALYAGWFLFSAGYTLRSGAARLTATVYQQSGDGPFLIVMAALSLVAALGTLRAAARTAVLLRAILLGVLGAVFLFSLPNLEMKNLFPLEMTDAPGIVLGAWPVLTVGGAAALFSFLNVYVEPTETPTKWTVPPLTLFSLCSCLLCAEAIGTFGVNVTTRLRFPFFTMVRDISLNGIAPRIEAVVIAMWVFADFILCAMLLRCAHEALRTVFGLPKSEDISFFSMKKGRFLLWLEAAAVFLLGKFAISTSGDFRLWSDRLVPLVMNCFVFGGFPLILLVGKLRKK